MLERGAFVVSIDTEMAWGEAHHRGTAARSASRSYEGEREVIAEILDLFARYEISATWAVVGHLFLDECHDEGSGPHPELVRPDYAWLDEDWLAIDPCSSLADDPFHYGPDIVQAILACPTPQEVGSHSFSHLIVDDPGCTPEVFTSELAAATKVAAPWGIELRSFVYPRNSIAQVERLAEHGYRSYRGKRAAPPFAGRPAWQRRMLRTIDRMRPLAGSAARPVRHPSGVWNIPQSCYFLAPTTRRRWRPTVRTYGPIARLRQAARHRSVFHMWFHPHNIVGQAGALKTLERICAVAAGLRQAGRLDTVSMGELARRLEAAPGSGG